MVGRVETGRPDAEAKGPDLDRMTQPRGKRARRGGDTAGRRADLERS